MILSNLLESCLIYRHETVTIKKIVEEISLKLRSIHLSNDENIIGMEWRMQDLYSSLGIGVNDKARMIGIKGMGGLGKTTLAKAIFNEVSSHFEGSSFVDNVREVSKKKGLRSLQKQLLSDVLNDKHMRVGSVYDGERIMRMRLPYKKILIVLDDVDDSKQLEALAGDWLKEGSRIIITTRDEKVLLAHGVNKNWIHDVNFLSDEEAISLFSWYAFKRYIPDQGYEELSSEVVRYAAGLPLTIKTLGSHLNGEEEDVWRDALNRLKTIPPSETLEVLKISYDGLKDHDHREMFLDVACFMGGSPLQDVINELDSCGYSAKYGLRILQQKSLIKILKYEGIDVLHMHDRIEELGEDIVRRSHPHSRLWICNEIKELLISDYAGTEASTCKGLRLDVLKELSPEIIIESLGKLKKLRYLSVYGNANDCFPSDWKFDQAKKYFPNSLQLLSWLYYPALSLPHTFQVNNLVGLMLPLSRITKFWESGDRKIFVKLRFLELSGSNLKTLDLEMTPNLERLYLRRCHDLTELHVPAGCVERLVHLDLYGCPWFISFSFVQQLDSLKLLRLPDLSVFVKCLEEFPSYSRNNLPKLQLVFVYRKQQPSSNETSLEYVCLDLQPCTKLESISGSICGLQHLRYLTLQGCIPELPTDIDQLVYLEKLDLFSTYIICLPDGVCMLKHLKSLRLKDCQYLEELPENLSWLENLEELSLSSTSIRRLPDSICMLKHMNHLQVESCGYLEKLPQDIGQLECLEELILTKCASLGVIPNSICKMKCLECFCVSFCSKVEKLPEEFESLTNLKVLDLTFTGVSHLPQSISSMNGLCIFGSRSLLQSCAFATEIQTSEEFGTFCYIQAMNSTPAPTEITSQSVTNTPAPTELRSQFTEDSYKRWRCW